MPLLLELLLADFQFELQQLDRVLHAEFQQFRNPQEYRAVLENHAAIGRQRNFAVRELIQGVHGLVRVGSQREVDDYLHLLRRFVFDALDLYLAFFVSGYDGIDKRRRGGAVGDFGEHQGTVVQLDYFGADFQFAAGLAVVIIGGVDHAARGEIRQQFELLFFQHRDAGLDDFHEVMGHDFGGQSHRDAFRALGQNQGKFHGEQNRFQVPAVVGALPGGGGGIEGDFQGKFAELRFDITRRGGAVARHGIAPVTLGFDEQILLTQIHQRVADGGVPMRMVFHGIADDIGHFVVAPVFHFAHGMQNAPLYGFESVGQMRHGPFGYHIGGVIQEIIPVHGLDMRREFRRLNHCRLPSRRKRSRNLPRYPLRCGGFPR